MRWEARNDGRKGNAIQPGPDGVSPWSGIRSLAVGRLAFVGEFARRLAQRFNRYRKCTAPLASGDATRERLEPSVDRAIVERDDAGKFVEVAVRLFGEVDVACDITGDGPTFDNRDQRSQMRKDFSDFDPNGRSVFGVLIAVLLLHLRRGADLELAGLAFGHVTSPRLARRWPGCTSPAVVARLGWFAIR